MSGTEPGAPLAERDWLLPACGAVAIAALWLLTHPYLGIDGDARIYVGRAMADLDPAGIGRQLDVVHDGQSSFTIFPGLLALAVRGLGPGAAAMTVSLTGLLAWLGAAGFLASRLFTAREAWVAMVGVVVLPLGYGGYHVFHAAEALATPRIFAEAGSLAALALWLDGRRLCATALWLAAMAIHPIMALAAGAVGYGLLVIEDRRWIWVAVVGGLAATIAAAAGVSLAVRVFRSVDPVWRALLADRSAEIFPALWPRKSWDLLAVQLAVVALGGAVLAPPFRRVAWVAVALALGGIAASIVAPGVLVVQAQLWRAQWLVAVLAGLALAPCVVSLARALWGFLQPRHGIALGLTIALIATAFAVGILAILTASDAPRNATPPPLSARAAWDFAFGLHPAGALVAGIVFGLAVTRRPRGWIRGVIVVVALLLAISGAMFWDRRLAPERARETPGANRALRAVLGRGQVYWLDSPGNIWLLTGRPDWWNQIESGGGLFDRALEMEWDRRFRVLERAGFATLNDVSFTALAQAPPPSTFGRAAFRVLCRSPNGPDWVMLPLARTDPTLIAMARTVWREPTWDYQRTADGWRRIWGRDQAAFACADFRGSGGVPDRAPGGGT